MSYPARAEGLVNMIRTQFCYIWPIDRTLSGASTPGQNGCGSDGNNGVHCISKSSSNIRAPPSDCLISYQDTCWGCLTPLQWCSRYILHSQPTELVKISDLRISLTTFGSVTPVLVIWVVLSTTSLPLLPVPLWFSSITC